MSFSSNVILKHDQDAVTDMGMAMFAAKFGTQARRRVRVPYRIAPLGAHVDHQFGRVTACAIDHGIEVFFNPSGSRHSRIYSTEFPGAVEFTLNAKRTLPAEAEWGHYAVAAAAVLGDRYALEQGIDACVVGAESRSGLSSSAAVGLGYLAAFAEVNGIALADEESVRLDERIEQDHMGLRNGSLDPAAITYARRGQLLELDTRTLQTTYHARSEGEPFVFLAVHSGIVQALKPENFNQRALECQQAAAALAQTGKLNLHEPVLGDIPHTIYAEQRDRLPTNLRKRADHFFSEVARVDRGVSAWRDGDPRAFGALMCASAQSSINNYECGATPVKSLVQVLNDTEGVYGARFCGPGFRGCCLALVEQAQVEEIAATVRQAYRRLHPEHAASYHVMACELVDGMAARRGL